MDKNRIGLVSIGTYLPDRVFSVRHLAERSGLTEREIINEIGLVSKRIPDDQDHAISMAIEATRVALERADGLSPELIDLVVFTGDEYREHIAQTAAIKLQQEVRAVNAWAFDMCLQGTTFVAGLKLAKDILRSDPYIETILLAGGTRNIDLLDERKKSTQFLLPLSASGAAAIIKRGHDRNLLLESAFHADFDMVDELYVPGGGTVHPFSHEILEKDLTSFEAFRPDLVLEYLRSSYGLRLVGVIEEVVRRSGEDLSSIGYLALRHLNPRQRMQVLEGIGLPEDRSILLSELGHHGPNDPILSLELALKERKVSDGDLVVLAAAGIGFSYGAIAIRWG